MAEDYENAPQELIEARIAELENQGSPLTEAQEEDLAALNKASSGGGAKSRKPSTASGDK